MIRILGFLMLLSACSGAPEAETDASVANRAVALESLTEIQTNQLINKIELEDQRASNSAATPE
jgi:hypothetical protein